MSVQSDTWRLLYRAIVGPNKRPAALRRPDSEDGSVRDMIAELETTHGGQKPAFEAAGVPRRTWQFWKAGVRRPKADRLDALRRVQRRSRVPAIRERWMRSEESQIGLHLLFRVSRDSRERKIIITGWRESHAARSMRRDILNAFFDMDGTRAVDSVENALSAGVNGDSEIEEIYDIRWFKTRAEALSWQRII